MVASSGSGPYWPFLWTVSVISRAAAGLLLHGLRHPGRPAAICCVTGRVHPR
jgi:hypothetical protein